MERLERGPERRTVHDKDLGLAGGCAGRSKVHCGVSYTSALACSSRRPGWSAGPTMGLCLSAPNYPAALPSHVPASCRLGFA